MAPLRIALVDNYDSFTWNLVHDFGALGAQVTVVRNDKITVEALVASRPDAIVLSPGPCAPKDAGICLDVLRRANSSIPAFGVCLGHQAIGEAFGGTVIRAPHPVHGKVAEIRHDGRGIFHGIGGPFRATRYHSLVVSRENLPPELEITAETDGLIMGLSHKTRPIHGVQFHPESIASEYGRTIMQNFLDLARNVQLAKGAPALSGAA